MPGHAIAMNKLCYILLLSLIPQMCFGATVYIKLIDGVVYYKSGATSCNDVTAGDTPGTLQAGITAAGAGGDAYLCSSLSTAAQLDGIDGTVELTSNLYIDGSATIIFPITSGLRMRANMILSAFNYSIAGEKPVSTDTLPTLTVSDPTYTIVNGFGTGGWEISNIHFTGAKRAISQTGSAQATYGNRWIHHCLIDNNGSSDSMGSAINFATGSDGGDIIEYNTISHNVDTAVKLGNDSTYLSTAPIIRYNNFFGNTCVTGTCEGHVVDFPIGSTGLQLYGNEFYNNADATNPTYSGYMISIDGTSNCVIYNNNIHDNNIGVFGMSAQLGGTSTGHHIYKNILSDNGFIVDQAALNYLSAAFFLKNSLGVANDFNSSIYNNTIVGHKTPIAYYIDAGVFDIISFTGNDIISGLIIRDNIIYNHDSASISVHRNAGNASITVTDDYNLCYSVNGGTIGDEGGENDVLLDPQFISPTDYRLRENSPARFAASDGGDMGALPYAPPTCFDGIQNQDETEVDNGGVCIDHIPPHAPASVTIK